MTVTSHIERFEKPPVMASRSPSAHASRPGESGPESAEQQLGLGQGLEVTAFTPGRFANAIQRKVKFTHARQLIREVTTTSFVMNLEPGGSATVCRGWRYLSFNDGPKVHTSEHIREQLGYRGRWESRGEWVDVDLKLDDSVCPRIGNYSHLVPSHAADWHLRCLPIMPKGHPYLTTPALACHSNNVEPVFGEDEPHIVAGILPNPWLVLGAGNGLRIKVVSRGSRGGEPPVMHVEYSLHPVPTNAWENSF